MGIMTAIVGGLIVSFFSGSLLTIKGPAAGLIVIVAGCVEGFGGGDLGWHLTLGVVVVSAIAQYFLGVFKIAKLADIFPVSAVHGLLAAIGVIIISRQFHLLLAKSLLNFFLCSRMHLRYSILRSSSLVRFRWRYFLFGPSFQDKYSKKCQ
jgi:MFS superfamily sulfate permease-like transporter